nr:Esterase ybfF [Klebsiella pneumoniae]
MLVHGLFGSPDNTGILARDLIADHDIVQVDMRNHGLSPRSPEMTYPPWRRICLIRSTRTRSSAPPLSAIRWAGKR